MPANEASHNQIAIASYPILYKVWRHIIIFTALLTILPFASASAGQVGDKDMTLICKFTRYGNSGAETKLTKDWIPPRQTHRIIGDEVIFDSYHKKLRGKVTKRNDERIEWTYQEHAEDIKGRRFGAIRIIPIFSQPRKSPAKWALKSIVILNMSGVLVKKGMKKPRLKNPRLVPTSRNRRHALNPPTNPSRKSTKSLPINGHICAAMVIFPSITMLNLMPFS